MNDGSGLPTNNNAREAIIARIRSALGKDAQGAVRDLEAVQARLRDHPLGPRPPFNWPDMTAQFASQAEALMSSVTRVQTLADVPTAIAHYVEDHKLERRAVSWPEFAGLDWRAAGLQIEQRVIRDGDLIGITGAYCGIAETGTLMLLSGPTTPAAMSLLPDTHIAVLRASRIVAGMEEAWNLLRHEHGKAPDGRGGDFAPRAVNFVSGPSRSGDIEMQIVLGVHGPYRVHIIVVEHDDTTPRELINTDWWRRPNS